jgi:ABC-type uncharacterized transport system auxiliary subunit
MIYNYHQTRASNCIKGAYAMISSMRNRVAAFALALVAVLICGCGAIPQSKYYELQSPRETNSAAPADAFPVTILIGPLKSSHLYREDKVVYATDNEQMGTYELQRWAAPPTEMLRDMLWRSLRASHRYNGVHLLTSNSHGDFVLEGNLYDFKEISGASFVARLNLALELRDLKTGGVVWTHDCVHDEPVKAKEVSAVVAALDENAQRCVTGAETSLNEYFSAHKNK